MNKYKVIYTDKFVKEKNLPSKYRFIFGQTEDSALADASIERQSIYGIYLLAPLAPEGTTAFKTEPPVDETSVPNIGQSYPNPDPMPGDPDPMPEPPLVEVPSTVESQESIASEVPVDSAPQTEFDFDAEAVGVAETAPVDRAGGADSIGE